MAELQDTLEHANYFSMAFRVESNCSDFQTIGSSPRKLKEIWVEWCETFICEDKVFDEFGREFNESGRFGKRFKSIVHARSFAMALVMSQINTTMLKKEEYEHWDGCDYKEEMEQLGKLKKVLFGTHDYEGDPNPSYRLVLDFVFDFENEE